MMVQTEIGLLPEDWKVVQISEVGSNYSYGVGAEAVMYDGKNKYLRITDIDDNSHRYSPAPIVSPSFFSENHILRENEIVVARTGASVGKSYIYDPKDGKLIYAGFLMKFKVADENSKYIFYHLTTKRYNTWVTMNSVRSGQPGLNLVQLKEFQFPLPKDKTEQQNIASALCSIDKLIDDLGRTIQKKQRIREGAMEELLSGKKRLPGFKDEWVEKPISYFGSFKGQSINPSTTPNEIYSEYSMPAYDEGMKPYQVKGADMLSSRTQIEGEVLLVNKLNVRQRRIWHIYNCEDNAICSGEFLPFKSSVIALDYLKQLLLTEKVVNDFIDLSTGTSNSQKRVTPKQILDYQITVPSDIREQHAIADILTSMDDEISLLESERAKYEKIRSGMMEELLTGKKRFR